MDPRELAPFIDYACLAPNALAADLDRVCNEALTFRFRGICVPSGAVSHAKRRLMNTGIKVVSTVSFPHGTASPDVKSHEAGRAAAMGADEIDYVISIGAALENNFRYIREEGVAVMRATRGKLVKAILETGYLDEQQKFECARVLADARVPYVKTCTGFGPGAATVEDVQLLAHAVQGTALIKASGGVHTAAQVLELLQAGAAVVGTSRGPEICQGS
jgi:deoxyribose-phosphate aldolase